ncbi:unnamed protein product [Lathyrus sativus]|nr:unnamed protein product [Lathyrus sativus]
MFIVESRPTPTGGTPICSTIHAVQVGETCFTLIQKFALEQPLFLRLNPNINCYSIFVGQWVCVNGRVFHGMHHGPQRYKPY